MGYLGRVKNGVVVFDEPLPLPEGTAVRVEPADTGRIPLLAERLKDVIGIAEGLPPDLAEHHDHYLYGKPKR